MTRFLALLSAFLALPILAACPARAPVTDCTPNTTRCGPTGEPEVCSASRRWQPTAAEPCPAGTACCLVTSLDPGGQVHACAPADGSACVEPVPGGAYAPPTPRPESKSCAQADGAWPGGEFDHGASSAEVAP